MVTEALVARASKNEFLQEFDIRVHYRCLGIIPKGHDTSRSYIRKPPDVSVDITHPLVAQFLLEWPNHQQNLEKAMGDTHTIVIWPPIGQSPEPVTLTCNMQDITHSMADKWSTIAPDRMKELLNGYTHRNLPLPDKGRNHCIQQISANVAAHLVKSQVTCDVSNDKASVNIYGVRSHVEQCYTDVEAVSSANTDQNVNKST